MSEPPVLLSGYGHPALVLVNRGQGDFTSARSTRDPSAAPSTHHPWSDRGSSATNAVPQYRIHPCGAAVARWCGYSADIAVKMGMGHTEPTDHSTSWAASAIPSRFDLQRPFPPSFSWSCSKLAESPHHSYRAATSLITMLQSQRL